MRQSRPARHCPGSDPPCHAPSRRPARGTAIGVLASGAYHQPHLAMAKSEPLPDQRDDCALRVAVVDVGTNEVADRIDQPAPDAFLGDRRKCSTYLGSSTHEDSRRRVGVRCPLAMFAPRRQFARRVARQPPVFLMAGFVARATQCATFTHEWAAAPSKPPSGVGRGKGLGYFKMKEAAALGRVLIKKRCRSADVGNRPECRPLAHVVRYFPD